MFLMYLGRRETKVVHVRINYTLIVISNNPNNNAIPLIILINLYLDWLSSVLDVLHVSLHLIKKKIHEQGIISVSLL